MTSVWQHGRLLVDLTYTPDGQQLMVAAVFNGIIWLDGQSYRELSTFPNTPRPINQVAVSQDGTKAAVAWSNGDVTLYPLTSAGLGPPMQRWVSGQPFHGAFALTFAAADSMLIWAIEGELVRVDLAAMTVLPALNNHRGRVAALASSPTTPHWALAAEDTVWLYHDDTPPIPLTGHTQAATSIRFSPDGQLLATGDSRGTVWLWRVSDGRLLKTLTGHQQIITELTFSPDGAWLLSGSQDRTVRFWGVHSR